MKEPYLDMRHRPHGKWFGQRPERKNPNNPSCPKCKTKRTVEIHQYAVIDSDGGEHATVYHCLSCDELF